MSVISPVQSRYRDILSYVDITICNLHVKLLEDNFNSLGKTQQGHRQQTVTDDRRAWFFKAMEWSLFI